MELMLETSKQGDLFSIIPEGMIKFHGWLKVEEEGERVR